MFALLAMVGLAAVAYAADSARVAFAAVNPLYEDVRVDQVYTDTNKWKEVEYSRGDSVTERCIHSMFPHGGYRPCWYVKSHTMNITSTD
jgi:hypothetical protein